MAQYHTQQEVESVDNVGGTVTSTRRISDAPVPDEHPQVAYHRKKAIFRTYQAVWYILGFVEFLLGFRFILKMLAANPASGFATLVYALSYPFALPFLGLFPSLRSGGVIFEMEHNYRNVGVSTSCIWGYKTLPNGQTDNPRGSRTRNCSLNYT